MGFYVSASPSVNVTEYDQSTVIPQVSSTIGAIAGVFRWGPIGEYVNVSSETQLGLLFGKPTNFNAETWFCAANFLAYGSSLNVSRAANTTDSSGANGVLSSYANIGAVTAANANMVVTNETQYVSQAANFDANVLYIAKYPGLLGNSLRISVCDAANQFTSNVAVANVVFTVGSNAAVLEFSNSTAATAALADFTNGDILLVGNSYIGTQYLKSTSFAVSGANINVTLSTTYNLAVNYTSVTSITRYWEFYRTITTGAAPGQSLYVKQFGNVAANDQLDIVIVDQGGMITGVPGQILETWIGLSRANDALSSDGSSIYYKTVLNQSSQWVWWANDRTGAPSSNALNVASSTDTIPLSLNFIAGSDGPGEANVTIGDLTNAWNQFVSPEQTQVDLLITGTQRGSAQSNSDPTSYNGLANWVLNNIAEVRKDCVTFISPPKYLVVNNFDGTIAQDIVKFTGSLVDSSYGVADSGYKYQYDKYNDINRYVPLNGDIAGLCAYTDQIANPWWSPAGYRRGHIKNLVKLAYNPIKADRDILYPGDVNPVITQAGQGTILFGDKTLYGIEGSAFTRINVRRLFIVLERAIATAAKFDLFEFNDAFTQAQFKNMVEPFLRDIQGQRGIYDFLVVCDGTNNTAAVVDANQFVGDIYIKPARAINWIQLNFIAVRSSVSFNEIIGNYGTPVG